MWLLHSNSVLHTEVMVIRKDSNSRIVSKSNDAANEWVSILIDECNGIWCKTLSFSTGITKILNMWKLLQIVERSVVALHLITVSVEMGFSKLSLIQPKTSHVHVYSVSQSLSDLQTIYWRKVVHLPSLSSHWPPQWGLNNFVWSTCKSPCLLLLLEIDLSLWRHVWSLVEEFDPGSEKVWPAMTMLPHLTAQTQLWQQKSITKLICVKNLNLKRHKKFYCIFCGHHKNLEVFTSRRTSGWQLAWKEGMTSRERLHMFCKWLPKMKPKNQAYVCVRMPMGGGGGGYQSGTHTKQIIIAWCIALCGGEQRKGVGKFC